MELKRNTVCIEYFRRHLLIVPYGIETKEERSVFVYPFSFNRTLWN